MWITIHKLGGIGKGKFGQCPTPIVFLSMPFLRGLLIDCFGVGPFFTLCFKGGLLAENYLAQVVFNEKKLKTFSSVHN